MSPFDWYPIDHPVLPGSWETVWLRNDNGDYYSGTWCESRSNWFTVAPDGSEQLVCPTHFAYIVGPFAR